MTEQRVLVQQLQGAAQMDGDIVPRRHLVGFAVPVGRDVGVGSGDDQKRLARPVPQKPRDRVRAHEVRPDFALLQNEGHVAGHHVGRTGQRDDAEPALAREVDRAVPIAGSKHGVRMHGRLSDQALRVVTSLGRTRVV